jgi:hypothetical protein
MTSGAQTKEGQFIDVGRDFHGVLIGSRVFLPPRWMMLKKIHGDVALLCWPCLVTKPSHMGVDVDGLACPLHYSTTYNHQTRGSRFLPGAVLSRLATLVMASYWGIRSPRAWTFVELLTVWVLVS